MHIRNLHIENYKAIQSITLKNLDDVVLITGSNGTGKSCILHAIRLLKSAYGGYAPNEWQQWFSEFGINLTRAENEYGKIMRDEQKPLIIKADFELSDIEKRYLTSEGPSIVENFIWKVKTGNWNLTPRTNYESIASEYRRYAKEVKEETSSILKNLINQLQDKLVSAKLILENGKQPYVKENSLLEIVFSTFAPDNIGLIDYHGADRRFENNGTSNINLGESTKETYKSSILYNHTNKYNNVKGEMLSSYVKALIAKESGEASGDDKVKSLNNSFKDLFNVFFDNKTFNGLIPDATGNVLFPVITFDGFTHDINDLSSGEKEVLFGYLRLLNTAPKNSIILIDEPELHLNPKMARKLPEFYYQNIGKVLNNQIWLVTHSEALVKEVIGEKKFSIYRLTSPSSNDISNQAIQLTAKNDIENLIIDLVGDVTAYTPGEKIIVIEGENSEFDKRVITELFASETFGINFISCGNKSRVKGVYSVLHEAALNNTINKKIYAITDRDSDDPIDKVNPSLKTFSWDCYHIENYLLSERHILKVLQSISSESTTIMDENGVEKALKLLAKDDIKFHVQHKLKKFINDALISCLKYKDIGDTLPQSLDESLTTVFKNLQQKRQTELNINTFHSIEDDLIKQLNAALTNSEWKSIFRGRNLLKSFSNRYCKGVDYLSFRNLIISEMKRDNYKPIGMTSILKQIISD